MLDLRSVEIEWLIKKRVNTVLLSSLFTVAPTVVSVVSFLVFVARGNELTISTAFTVSLFCRYRLDLTKVDDSQAITLFNMIR